MCAKWPSSVRFRTDMTYSRGHEAIPTGGGWSWDHQRRATRGCAAPGKLSACGHSSSSPTRSPAPGTRSGCASRSRPAPCGAGNPTPRHGRTPITRRPSRRCFSARSPNSALPRRGPALGSGTPQPESSPAFSRRHGQPAAGSLTVFPQRYPAASLPEFCRHRLHLRHLGPSAHVLDRPAGPTA